MAQPANCVPLHINTELDLDLGPRFVEVQPKGFGANGIVYSAIDRECDKKVAIKRISFGDSTSCKYALREITILRRMQHENIVGTHEILGLNGKSLDCESNLINVGDLCSVYIVQDLLDADLFNVIQSGQMKEEHIKFFVYQLLRGLKYLHSANVVHRDLKPSNILIDCDNSMLKIGDFGLSRVIDPDYDHGGVLTENMGTSWYRSPEQILHPRDYNKAIDLWSAGCIFGEMLTGRPLCRGVDDLDQLLQILDTVRLQDGDWDEVLTIVSNKALQNHPLKITVPLRERLALVDIGAVDLLESLLVFNPSVRLTAEEALQHPYLREYSCVNDEPIALSPFHIEYEIDNQPVNLMKQMILEEINCQESCGSQTDWIGWEALHAMQNALQRAEEFHEEETLVDNNGNISPIPIISKCASDEDYKSAVSSFLTPSLSKNKILDLTCSSLDNRCSQNQENLESPTDLEMSKKFFEASLFESSEHEPKMAAHPVFEMNEKYLVEEKERNCATKDENLSNENENCAELDDVDRDECINEDREAAKNMRNVMEKSNAFQPCIDDYFNLGDHLTTRAIEIEKQVMPEFMSSASSDFEKVAYTSIISYDSEEDDRNVINFNMKNNALNSQNDSNGCVEDTYENDLDIFSLRDQKSNYASDKDIKHDIAQEIAFKEEFNLRQKMNSGLQFHNACENQCSGFDFSLEKNVEYNNQNNHQNKNRQPKPFIQDQDVCDSLRISPTNFLPVNRNNHLANERIRKNLLSQKLSLHSRHENSLFWEDGFLSNHDSACSLPEPTSPTSSSMDWILFEANSGLHFPPLQVPTSQRITDESIDNMQTNCTMFSQRHDEEFSSRAHPSGAKPKKISRKTKAL